MKYIYIILLFFFIRAEATNYTWSGGGNVLINRTNYPTLTGGDTVFIPSMSGGYRSQTYKNLYCNHIAPTQAQLIHIIWQSGAYITPSTSSLQANSIDSVYGVEVRGCNQNDMIDPFFWSYGATGYLKYVLFNRDTLRGTNGFFGSYNPTLTLPAFTGDSTNCFYHIEWRGCLWDSVIGANSGETALWLGTVTSAKNQFWVYPTIDSCTFANYSSTANPSNYIHMETCFGAQILNDSFSQLGMATGTYVGHAADIYVQASQFYLIHCIFWHDFGDGIRNIGAGQIKGWNTVPAGMGNTNGRSIISLCKTYNKIKYPFCETRTDPGDTSTLSPYYQYRTCPEIWNVTGWHMAIGVGHQDYNSSLVDAYGLDSVFLKNSALVGPLADTNTWTFSTGIYANALITNPNGPITTWDTTENTFDSTAALAQFDTVNFRPVLNGGMYNNGITVPTYVSIQGDLKGVAMPVAGRSSFNLNTGIDRGVNMLPNATVVTYYWADSANGGNDGNAGTISAPFRTLNKIHSLTLAPGYSCLFNRGDTITGIATINQSGSSGLPIYFGPYGNTALPDPVLGGLYDLGPWTSLGGNKYEAYWPGIAGVASPNNRVVIVNGIQYHICQNPNTGYSTFTSSTSTSITDPTYSGINCAGCGIFVRSSYFTIDKGTVTAQTGSTTFNLSFTQSYLNNGGNGYVLTNNAAFLDAPNEYFVNGDSVEIYDPSNPNAVPAYSTIYDSTMQATSKSYYNFNHLQFIGANAYGLFLNTTPNVNVTNCTFSYMGFDALYGTNCNFITVSNFIFKNVLNNSITLAGTSSYPIISNGLISQNGAIYGMGGSGGQSYEGIDEAQIDAVITGVTIDTCGGNPIYYGSLDSTQVTYNVVNYHNFVWIDGGAFYTFSAGTPTITHRIQVNHNIAMNGMGLLAYPGTTATGVESTSASGFYGDGHSCCQDLLYNTAFNESANGFYIHGTSYNLQHNNSFNNTFANYQLAEASGGVVITGLNLKHNFSGGTSANPAFYWYTPGNDLASFGASDSNYVGGPAGSSTLWYTKSSADVGTHRTLAGFQSNLSGYDAHSTFQTGTLSLIYSAGSPTLWNTNGLCTDLTGVPRFYGYTITPPWSSTITKVIPGNPIRLRSIQ